MPPRQVSDSARAEGDVAPRLERGWAGPFSPPYKAVDDPPLEAGAGGHCRPNPLMTVLRRNIMRSSPSGRLPQNNGPDCDDALVSCSSAERGAIFRPVF